MVRRISNERTDISELASKNDDDHPRTTDSDDGGPSPSGTKQTVPDRMRLAQTLKGC
jgi:hypothetical protein